MIKLNHILFPLVLSIGAVSTANATPEYDNFYKSEAVVVKKVKFKNLYGMNIAANLIMPKDQCQGRKCKAIVIGHPFAAVKEQAANLYATKLAEKGFVTLAFDQPF